MDELKCFSNIEKSENLNFNSFEFTHNLSNHKSFEVENIKKLISDLPRYQVVISSEDSSLKTDIESILSNNHGEMDLNSVFSSLKESRSYIALNGFENHELFKEIHENIIHDLKLLLKKSNRDDMVTGASFWMFIASPKVVTPFHFDRFSNFIMQIKGEKILAVFPHFRDDIIPQVECEKYSDGEKVKSIWRDELDKEAKKYSFSEGQAVHIPYNSGHYVQNGEENISITLSIFFHTKETLTWSRAHRFNNRIRKIGIKPSLISTSSSFKNYLKAYGLVFTSFLKSK